MHPLSAGLRNQPQADHGLVVGTPFDSAFRPFWESPRSQKQYPPAERDGAGHPGGLLVGVEKQ